MTDERLNGLALLFVHPDITLDYDALLTNFGNGIVCYNFVSRPIKWNAFGSGAS